MLKQLRVPLEGSDTIEDYTVFVLETYIVDEVSNWDEPEPLSWLMLLNKFSNSASAQLKYETFNDLLGVGSPSELAPIYNEYLDQIADYLEVDSELNFPMRLSENAVYDYKQHWVWHKKDPLVLKDNNKGLVARYVVLKVLHQLDQDLLSGSFSPYES